MSTLAITNIGLLVSGNLIKGLIQADTVMVKDGIISQIGWAKDIDVQSADRIIDAQGSCVTPGLIDSHTHIVLGDWTPRQNMLGWIERYLHGGVTTQIGAGEGHLPGRPKDATSIKALAVLAYNSYKDYRPGGVKVHAGRIMMEPSLTEADYAEAASHGVWLAKCGLGGIGKPPAGAEHTRWAQKYGMSVLVHTGGASIPGNTPIGLDDLLQIRPDVVGHANGGPTGLTPEEVRKLVLETDMVLEMVQAGNVKRRVECVKYGYESNQLHRFIIGSDTPTGTGVITVGVIKTVAEISSLNGIPATMVLAMATGNTAKIYGLNCGLIEVGRDGDFMICDTPLGSVGKDALEAIEEGDIPGISMTIIDGQVTTQKSINTPPATRQAIVVK
jgi:enamidase